MRLQQLFTILGIAVFIVTGVAATTLPRYKHKNLKVLPQDISDEKLDSIMNSYNKALGVDCNFCHSASKNVPDSVYFSLDDNPLKDNARKMIRLTIQLNKDYFYYDSIQRPEYLNVVSCFTCHRGDPFPIDLKGR